MRFRELPVTPRENLALKEELDAQPQGDAAQNQNQQHQPP
jgi:hypothetical protein